MKKLEYLHRRKQNSKKSITVIEQHSTIWTRFNRLLFIQQQTASTTSCYCSENHCVQLFPELRSNKFLTKNCPIYVIEIDKIL